MTVAEVLKAAGMTDEQITALDAKVVEGFTGVMTAAEQDRQAAELAQRSANELFEKQITPALNEWGNKEANLQAERDYYKTLAEKAKTGGFIADAPPFTPAQPRNDQGQFVPGTTGSPQINVKELEQRFAGGIGALTDLQWKYRKIFGEEMPDAPTALMEEAERNRMPFPEWAARKYNFAGKELEIAAKKAADHDAAIRKEERAIVDREYAERAPGSGPTARGVVSNYSDLKKGVTEGARQDPLQMSSDAERSRATQEAIRKDLASRMVQ